MKRNWYKPLVFWSWNAKLKESELLTQMEDFKKAEFGGVIIHARSGLKTPYLGDEWFRLCEVVCKRAKQLELDVYLYDEDGWPSGFAGDLVPTYSDDFCQRKVNLSTARDYNDNPIAAYRKQNDGKYTLVWQKNSTIEMPEADIYAFETINRSYTDILNREAIAYFIEVTHEKYYSHLRKYFGNVIKGIFTDEPQLVVSGFHWGSSICKAYEEECSSSLLEDLWMLYLDAPDKYESKNIRLNYRTLIQKLLNENYTKQISSWCTDHNIEMTGHFPVEDGQYMQIEATAGVMRHYGDFHLPGIDHLGRRLAPLPLLKQVQSSAQQTGKSRVLSESFGCAGWSLTFEEMKEIWSWQAINGINTPCFHLSAYSLEGRRKRDYPPVFSYQEPWFSQMHHISNWMKEVNSFFSECTRFADILIIQPLIGMFSIYSPKQPAEAMRLSNEFRKLTENFRDLQLDYDIGDETILCEDGSVQDKLLCVGLKKYKMVVVSENISLEKSTLELLRKFAENGGVVLYIGRIPENAKLIPGNCVTNYAPMLRKYLLHTQWEFPLELKTADDKDWLTGIQTFIGQEEDGSLRIGIYSQEEGLAEREINLYLKGHYEVFFAEKQGSEFNELSVRYFDNTKGKTSLVSLLLLSKSLIILKAKTITSERISQAKKTLPVTREQILPLQEFNISRLDPNCLMLDIAKLILDGQVIENQVSVYHIREKILQLTSGQNNGEISICVEYSFQISSDFDSPLMLAAESEAMNCLEVNGTKIDKNIDSGYYIDKSIRCFEIDSAILGNINTISCYYIFGDNAGVEHDLSFETERNRFCPEKEVESIYLLGDFSVNVKEGYIDYPRYLLVDENANSSFVISPTSPLSLGELTTQGLWFYRGNISYTVLLPVLPANQSVFLSINKLDAIFCTVRINDNEEELVCKEKIKINLTDGLEKSNLNQNVLTITLFGSNRNVFGPHHHCKGELDFVGTESFEGKYNWADAFNPEIIEGSTWIDGYTFIHFGMDSCNLIIESKY